MKFIAMLKDSFREAVDVKVMYVMVGLSGVLILIVLSMSFKPASAHDFMQFQTSRLNQSMYETERNQGRVGRGKPVVSDELRFYNLESVEPISGDAKDPDSNFHVVLTAQYPNPEAAEKARQSPEENLDFLRKHFGATIGPDINLHLLEVTQVQLAPNKPGEERNVAFTLDTKPTDATRRFWPHEISLFFGLAPLSFLPPVPLGLIVYFVEDIIVNGIGAWVALLLSVVVTAFFIPNMMRKGTIDMLLVKPIPRIALLGYKYLGGLVFILVNATVAVGGVWLALGLRSGIWAPSFLLYILVLTTFFAILYSVSTFFGVLTQSPIVVILLTIGFWFGLFCVGQAYSYVEMVRVVEERTHVPEAERTSTAWWAQAINAVHFVLPRPKDLDQLTSRLLVREVLTGNQLSAEEVDKSRVNWGESLTVSALFVALMLGLSCWWFSTRDY